jgi:putative ABC transport system permease protein
LLVQIGDPRTAPNPDLTAAQRADLDRRAAAVVDALGTNDAAVPLDVAFPERSDSPNLREPIALGRQTAPHSLELVGYPYIATPEVLSLYGIDAASFDDNVDLLTERDEPLLTIADAPKLDAPPAPAKVVALPTYGSAPNSLLTESAVQRHGWRPARAGWIVEAAHPLSSAQINAARTAAVGAGLAIEVRSRQDGLSAVRTGSTLVGALLALAIVAMAVGLIRGESTRDLRTLTATGASARTRRALTASTAAALAALGVVLGTTGAYVALVAAFHSDLDLLVPVPVGNLVSLAVGLPLAATVAGWLLAGKEPSTFHRQALD